MAWRSIEPRSPGPLANTLSIRAMSRFKNSKWLNSSYSTHIRVINRVRVAFLKFQDWKLSFRWFRVIPKSHIFIIPLQSAYTFLLSLCSHTQVSHFYYPSAVGVHIFIIPLQSYPFLLSRTHFYFYHPSAVGVHIFIIPLQSYPSLTFLLSLCSRRTHFYYPSAVIPKSHIFIIPLQSAYSTTPADWVAQIVADVSKNELC